MSSNPGVELKGGMYTFMSLKLHTDDTEIINQFLADKVHQAPAFFKDTPVVVDLTVIEAQGEDVDLDSKALLDCIRSHQLVPIVASISNKSSPLAQSIAIPLIEGYERKSGAEITPAKTGKEADKKDEPADADADNGQSSNDDSELSLAAVSREIEYVVKAPLFIDKPVRSGQQVYARDTDLIVMGPIGPGAEVIADNNIHIYGPLRGRALCGVSGNTATRIFCQSLEAELVSVAGNYRMLETIPEELRGKPAQIWLDQDRLNIEPL